MMIGDELVQVGSLTKHLTTNTVRSYRGMRSAPARYSRATLVGEARYTRYRSTPGTRIETTAAGCSKSNM